MRIKKFLMLITAAALMVATLAMPAMAGGGVSQQISAKSLTDQTCDSSEWHFVITQVATEYLAPASIEVEFSGGDTVTVPLGDYTGKTAHYTEVSHLDETVVSATADIYNDWSGQFNLSHGPCGDTPPPPPANGDLTCPGEYSLPVTTRAHGSEGSEILLATVNVDPSAVGETASVTAVAENQSSVHPGNDLVVASGSTSVVLENVERAEGVETPANGTLTLGTTITVTLLMGPDEVFSAGIMLSIVCVPETEVVFPVGSAEAVCEGEIPGYDVTVSASSAIDDIAVVDSADFKFTELEGSYAEGQSRTEFVAANQVTGPLLLLYRSEPIQLVDLPSVLDCEEQEETTTTTAPKVEDTSTTAPPTTKASTATTTPVQNGDFGDGPSEGSSLAGLIALITGLFGAATAGIIYRSRLSRQAS